ncbi:hypothetical protein [Pelomonas sp. SE-A7]|uniref:hypothetical protein n=1 Tax=Pelomonas sp. SE-A7 TaxID=3054953 RepID=UPI00259D2547|nr:hypothetical protein [Pelomonas sp. SE-A7]MDM4768557.1 hypothetical protein [Pelomonas sp. SE-A7]
MQIVLRFVALVVIANAALIANAYAQQYWAGLLFPLAEPRPYTEMVSAALAGALAAAVVSAFPLAWLFRKWAWLAGLAISLPVIAVRAPELGASTLPNQQVIFVMAWVEMLSYTVLVTGAAWVLARRRALAENAL